MRISPIVLLLFAMLGCGSGTQPATPSAKSGGNQVQQQKVATPEKQAASPAEKAPDAAAVKKHMTADQLALGEPIVNSIDMLLVPISAGEFQMGSPDSVSEFEEDGKPQHLVKITKPFYLSVYEVTQQQYEKVKGTRSWQGDDDVHLGPDYPATHVTWNEAAEFCRKLSEQEGVKYHLPTEAQWEYACRAGTTTVFSFGNDESNLEQHAWYHENSSDDGVLMYAQRVGRKLPNSWGLYDMHGNTFEWCQDWYAPYDSETSHVDPAGPELGEFRVLRGGSFATYSGLLWSANRHYESPDERYFDSGFRVARTYP